MAFVTKDTGEVVFIPPSNEEIIQNKKDIVEVEETKVQRELTKELQEKIAEHARYLVSSNQGILPFTNRNIYSTIKNLVVSPLGSVDIVLPIYNSIHIAKQCIEKVFERTVWPFHLYIVDDDSDLYTKECLAEIAKKHSNITVITNSKNRGFAASVNRGIKAGNGQYVCLLNSDVLVTDMWLTKMVLAAKADNRNQIICPATNNTAIVDIPMSQGSSYLTMNNTFEKFAVRNYPQIMATGFCMLFPRDLIDKIGLLDESYVSYGEDSEFWFQTINYQENGRFKNYQAVMADDCYVFHERSSSFSSLGAEGHMGLRKSASSKFNERNPSFREWQKSYSVKKALGHLRDKIPSSIVNDQKFKYRVCWVVHATDRCGGMSYIADIVNEMIERGIDAKIALIKRTPEMRTDYIGELRTAPVVFEDYFDFLNNFNLRVFGPNKKGLVVAATVELSSVVRSLCDNFNHLTPVLHCQSHEPDLVDDPTLISKIKQSFRLIPNVITNSKWITDIFTKEYDITPFATVNPGVDIDLFYPRNRSKGDDRLTICIPVSKNEYRGYSRVLKLIPELESQAKARRLEMRILLVGANKNPIPASTAIALGAIPPVRLATLLGNEVDLFVEPSKNHSYGLPAIEAMVSGVPVVSWENKGIREYANDSNSLIIDDGCSIKDAARAILDILEDKTYRTIYSERSLELRNTHSRKVLIDEFINQLEKKFNLNFTKRRIVVVVPHLRKHGGPTTMLAIANELANHGHDVSINTLYADLNPEVIKQTNLQIDTDSKNIPKCDLAIINSDNPLCPTVAKSPSIKKKIMLKLSHNARFKQLEEEGLQQKWDAIVTSSDWLKNACENVTPSWNYPSQSAHRIGWWHYSHEQMAKNPQERTYGDGINTPITIGTLIHNHPLKGSTDAIQILGKLHSKYGDKVQFIGIGEVDPRKFQLNLPNFQYRYAPNREELATALQSMDIWFGASKTEGLGRMGLEAMSAGCAVVVSDTGPEYANPGINCLLYPVNDADAALSQLDRLMTDAELRKQIQVQGFKTAQEKSNPTECIESLEKIIGDLF